MKKPVLFISLVLLSLNIFSQEDKEYHSLTAFQSHYGFIIPHTEAIEPVSHTKPYGFELSFSRLHTSYEKWKVFRHYNITGIQATYFNFQDPDIVGNVYALSTFTEPLLVTKKKFIFSVKAGAGFSYQTKIYDYTNDSLNKFFSTRISFPLYLSARLKYRVAPKTFLTLAGTFNHISNGAVKIPNFGINFPTISLGIEYFQKPFPVLDDEFTTGHDQKLKRSYILLQSLIGYKTVYGEFKTAFGVSARYTRQIRTFYAFNGGMELILDGGVKKMIAIEDRSVDYKRLALTAGQDFFLGKVSFTQYLGIYVYSPYRAKHPVYQKYELAYRIFPDVLAGVYLKAHTSDAELFGFSLNYILRSKS
jgi:hypothetical protein